MFKIVNTDNYGGDYPDEKFLPVPPMSKEEAEAVAEIINRRAGGNCSRFWKVVELPYILEPGFEP